MIKPQEQVGLATRKRILMLAFAISAVLALIAVLPSIWVRAQSEHLPCVPPSDTPSRVFELVPQIPQLSPSDIAVGIFVTHTFSIDLEDPEIVCLASSPDGRGMLRVDDQVDLRVTRADGSKEYWTYNFYDPITGGITNVPSQDVSSLFGAGRNDVLIFLTDVKPNYHSAEPIWLLIWHAALETPTNMPRPTASSAPSPLPTLSNESTPIVAPTPTAIPSRTWRIPVIHGLVSILDDLDKGNFDSGAFGVAVVLFLIAVSLLTIIVAAVYIALRPHAVALGHFLARLSVRVVRKGRISSIRSYDPSEAFESFDDAMAEISKPRTKLSSVTAYSVEEYFEALYESVGRDENKAESQ